MSDSRERTYPRNLYAGKCILCGGTVERYAGILLRVDGVAKVQHRGDCPEVVVPEPTVRRNQYAKDCGLCGRRVPAGEGILDKDDQGDWVVWHDGPCQIEFPFPEGRYAIEREGQVRFYHCTDGDVYVMASDNEILVQPHAAEAIVEQIALDSLAAAKLYGIEFEQCGVCGRGLTSEWRKVGIGPVCAQKGWG